MKKIDHPLPLQHQSEYDKETDLINDIKAWIEEDDFEPPFPYNVLWNPNSSKTQKLRILATAAQQAYDNAVNEELKWKR